MTRKPQKKIWIVLLKYGFSLMTTLLAFFSTGRRSLLLFGPLELALIWAVSNALMNKARVAGHLVHFLLLLLFNAQMLVMYFGNDFITLVMVTNLVSLQDLSGSFGSYLLLLVPMVAILCLPMPVFRLKAKPLLLLLGGVCGAWLCAVLVFSPGKSPLANLGLLARDAVDFNRLRGGIGDQADADAAQFYKAAVADGRPRPQALPERPNIVLIFVEGLSQSIIEDERGLMPNLAALEQKTLFFENYYNHAFATYRGLIGQLYSGYQLSDRDANQLISLQAILHDFGYRTAFINTEPNNAAFTGYLEAMGFDDFISERDWITQAYVTLDYITDRNAFDRLFDTITAQRDAGQPFFTAMYSMGTHVSFDSPDALYGDGGNPELNKFYNLDVQLGRFMERFDESALAEDTLVVITTDHATYTDKAFTESFPDYTRAHSEMDRVPLMLYYRGMEPETINAKGRNSLDLAPTILDFIDLSAPNMFLGDSLFAPQSDNGEFIPYDRCFFDGASVAKTGSKKKLSKAERNATLEHLLAYFTVSIPSDQGFKANDMVIETSEDGKRLLLSSRYALEPDQRLWFAVWGRADWTNDLVVYPADLDEDGVWRCAVPLEDHGETGIYYIHARVSDQVTPPEGNEVIMKNYYVEKIG